MGEREIREQDTSGRAEGKRTARPVSSEPVRGVSRRQGANERTNAVRSRRAGAQAQNEQAVRGAVSSREGQRVRRSSAAANAEQTLHSSASRAAGSTELGRDVDGASRPARPVSQSHTNAARQTAAGHAQTRSTHTAEQGERPARPVAQPRTGAVRTHSAAARPSATNASSAGAAHPSASNASQSQRAQRPELRTDRTARSVDAARHTEAPRSYNSRAEGQHNSTYEGGNGGGGKKTAAIVIGGILLLAVIGGGSVFALKQFGGKGAATTTEASIEATVETTAFDPNVIQGDFYLDYSAIAAGDVSLMNLNGMNREQVAEALKAACSWSITVKNTNPNLDRFSMPNLPDKTSAQESTKTAEGEADDGGTPQEASVDDPLASVTIRPSKSEFSVPNLMADSIDSYVDQLFASYQAEAEKKQAESSSETETEAKKEAKSSSESASTEATSAAARADYVLAAPDFSEQLKEYASQLALVWKASPKNGDITSYDASSGKFKFGGEVNGYSIDADALASALIQAVSEKQYTASIDAPGAEVAPSSDVTSKYKTISSFTTKTTSNQVRNQNIKLACEAINGHVMQPGESFSFNDVVGERTKAKGYGAAAAYSNGEVVQEVGGGVCQVSTTLYNAVFRAGLTTTSRRSHTFEPSYVTPGLDATVSWGGPDYKFVNSSDHAIGIRASYSDQTCTISIYGVPVLPDGVTWELSSTKVKSNIEPPTSIISSGKPSNGSYGSEWQVYKVVKKNGTEVERTKDHYSAYRGHTKTVLSGAAAASSAASETTSTAASTSAAETTTQAAQTTAAQTKAEPTSTAATTAVSPAGPGEEKQTTAAPKPEPTTAAQPSPEPTTAAQSAGPGAAGPGEDVPVLN